MKPRQLRRLIRIVIFGALLLFVAANVLPYSFYTIPEQDHSLLPSYPGGTRLLVREVDEEQALERGLDVVYAMEREGVVYARFGRLFGLPGDTIDARDGLLHVNGESTSLRGPPAGEVPPGTVYILAPNPFWDGAREGKPDKIESLYIDSRTLGFIQRDAVRAIILSSVSVFP